MPAPRIQQDSRLPSSFIEQGAKPILDREFTREHADAVRHAIKGKLIDLDRDGLLAVERAVAELGHQIQALWKRATPG